MLRLVVPARLRAAVVEAPRVGGVGVGPRPPVEENSEPTPPREDVVEGRVRPVEGLGELNIPPPKAEAPKAEVLDVTKPVTGGPWGW